VAPIHFARHHTSSRKRFTPQQRVLPFVEKYEAVVWSDWKRQLPCNAALRNNPVDAVGDVDELRTIVGDPVKHPVKDLEARRRSFGIVWYYFNFRDFRVRTHARSSTTL
jgi:hypothetical protein